jgi:hypothetical protein
MADRATRERQLAEKTARVAELTAACESAIQLTSISSAEYGTIIDTQAARIRDLESQLAGLGPDDVVGCGFGIDPKDSAALLALRNAIDEELGWETQEEEEAGDYVARVRQVGAQLAGRPAPIECEMVVDPSTDEECRKRAIVLYENVPTCFDCLDRMIKDGGFERRRLRVCRL